MNRITPQAFRLAIPRPLSSTAFRATPGARAFYADVIDNMNKHGQAVESQWARKRDQEALEKLRVAFAEKAPKAEEPVVKAAPVEAAPVETYKVLIPEHSHPENPTMEDFNELRRELIGKVRILEDEVQTLRFKLARK